MKTALDTHRWKRQGVRPVPAAQGVSRKGQIGVFIILAILMLLAIAALMLVGIFQQPQREVGRATTFETLVHDVEQYIQGCIALKASEPVTQLALKGGRFAPSTGIYHQGTQLHALCVYQTGKGCVSTVTTKASLEEELVKEVFPLLTPCMDIASEFRNSGLSFTGGTPALNASITADAVTLTLFYPLSLRLGTDQRDLSVFSAGIDVPLGRLFGTALDIANAYASTGFFDKDQYMEYHDTGIQIKVFRPYPHVVYQLMQKNPRTLLDFTFQFGLEGKKTAGMEPLTFTPAFGCCFANDNTCHTNAPSSQCKGSSEAKGCHCPANAVPEIEGCCVRGDSTCSPSRQADCTSSGETYIPDDRLCAKVGGCSSLDCEKTYDMPSRSLSGPRRKNGESWCVYDGSVGNGNDLVGSRHYVHSCVRGREYVEPCRDYREELCAEFKSESPSGGLLSHAACRINRYADCTSMGDAGNCGDLTKRDCEWLPTAYGRTGAPVYNRMKCIPTVAPGLPHWAGIGEGICQHSSDDNPPRKRKRTWGHQVQHACAKSGDCGAKRNIVDVLTKGGYFNPDGGLEDDKLVPPSGRNRIAYPGLAAPLFEQAVAPVLPNLRAPASGGSHAICKLWQAPSSGDCSVCMSNPFHPCTEYQCKSLGRNCVWKETAGMGSCSVSGTMDPLPHVRITASNPMLMSSGSGAGRFQVQGALHPHQPLSLLLKSDQKVRCLFTLRPPSYSAPAFSWGICPVPEAPDLCVQIPSLYLSRHRFQTEHNLTVRFMDKEGLVKTMTDFADSRPELKPFQGRITSAFEKLLSGPVTAFIRCSNENETEATPIEIKVVVPAGSLPLPPSILEIQPLPEEFPPEKAASGETITASLFVDRPFSKCFVQAAGGSSAAVSCQRTFEPGIVYNDYAPAGSFACEGIPLVLNNPSFTFTCANDKGTGPSFVYKVGSAADVGSGPGLIPLPFASAGLPAPAAPAGSVNVLPAATVPSTPSPSPSPPTAGQGCIIGCEASGWLRPPDCASQGIPLERGSSTCCKDRGFPCLEQEIKTGRVVEGHLCSQLQSLLSGCGLS